MSLICTLTRQGAKPGPANTEKACACSGEQGVVPMRKVDMATPAATERMLRSFREVILTC